MKIKDLSPHYDDLKSKPVTINTTIPIQTEEGTGIITYRGIIVDEDDHFVYLGNNEDSASNMIPWARIVSIDVLDIEEESELLRANPASGSKN